MKMKQTKDTPTQVVQPELKPQQPQMKQQPKPQQIVNPITFTKKDSKKCGGIIPNYVTKFVDNCFKGFLFYIGTFI